MAEALWRNPYYVQTVTSITIFFLVFGAVTYYLQSRNPKWIGVWASIKSWVVAAPLVFFFAALPAPWPLIFVVLVSIFSAKTFFRMTGMYHRSWFIWTTYLFLILQGYAIWKGYDRFFNIMPMAYFTTLCMIPILRRSATHMIQYLALSLMNFLMIGWGFMHFGRIVMWDNGPMIALYLFILFEFCESANYVLTRAYGRFRPLQGIAPRFSVEGFLSSLVLTLILAWALRHMLPNRSEIYWLSAGLTVAVVGRVGGLILSVIRRDLGIKDTGIFIIGRDDILARVDKPMFAAPAFYFIIMFLEQSYKI